MEVAMSEGKSHNLQEISSAFLACFSQKDFSLKGCSCRESDSLSGTVSFDIAGRTEWLRLTKIYPNRHLLSKLF